MGRKMLRAVVVGVGLAGLLSSSGCAIALVGAGAAAGYAISNDSVRNSFDLPKGTVFNEALDVMSQMGQVTLEDPAHGEIKGKVGGTSIWITVKPITRKTVQLKVKARNSMWMPKVDMAQEVYNKIIERF